MYFRAGGWYSVLFSRDSIAAAAALVVRAGRRGREPSMPDTSPASTRVRFTGTSWNPWAILALILSGTIMVCGCRRRPAQIAELAAPAGTRPAEIVPRGETVLP